MRKKGKYFETGSFSIARAGKDGKREAAAVENRRCRWYDIFIGKKSPVRGPFGLYRALSLRHHHVRESVNMEKIIKVTGKGKLAVKPDTVRLILSLEGTEKEYGRALKKSAELTEKLKTALEPFGFAREDLKTLGFGVESRYESYETKAHAWKQRFVGYAFSHRMKLQFPADNERLGKILYALGHCKAKPEIGIEYTVADPEAVKNELLAKAAADARAKAEVLSRAAGAVLGALLTIDYSWEEMEFVARPMARKVMTDCCEEEIGGIAAYGLDIQADDISVEDTVTFVWEIQ